MDSKTRDDRNSGSRNCYAAVLERAKVTVEQWDNHDQYRQTEADKSLNDPQIGEPDDVAIARALLSASGAANELERGCKLYCGWYDTGTPQMEGVSMAYELVSFMRQALHKIKGG
ncbi:MAG: hypothetical protein GY903_20850 [Fuerstiella sp.]|nr:hypothetical protein [Fuerstiella sp.]MCP4856939.1 hypothetical protein [Fuerstiella sp.]